MSALEKLVESKGKRFVLKVEDSPDPGDYRKYEELREAIWRFPEDGFASTRNMMCENFFYDGSSLYIGVYAVPDEAGGEGGPGDELVGFAYGFVGVRDKRVGFRRLGNLWFYAQYTGVKPGYEHYGLGVLIKEFQREALIELFGITSVTCTYDPLTGVNAYRNIHRFGMDVMEYKLAVYGAFGGRLNREDVPSDRFQMLWDLKAHRERCVNDIEALLEARSVVTRVEQRVVEGKSGPVELEILRGVDLEAEGECLLLEIPVDFYRMLRETDVGAEPVRRIPVDWRLGTREAFNRLFAKGYAVADFRQVEMEGRKRDFYVLKRPGGAQHGGP